MVEINSCPDCGRDRVRKTRNLKSGKTEKYWHCPFCAAFRQQVYNFRKLSNAELDIRAEKAQETLARTLRVVETVKAERVKL